jgi:hypothetical protein
VHYAFVASISNVGFTPRKIYNVVICCQNIVGKYNDYGIEFELWPVSTRTKIVLPDEFVCNTVLCKMVLTIIYLFIAQAKLL